MTGRRVQLMATCLCDAFFDDVARATVEVLEHLGCEVAFPEDQTCCGQPAFNSGDWPAARTVARHALKVFDAGEPVVVPSGSCARMVSHGALLLFEGESDSGAVGALAARTWELGDFVVRALGITRWPGKLPLRVAFHRSCHSRGTAYAAGALTLLKSIEGVEVVEIGEAEQCCGFGGTFSVAFPQISRAIGTLKIDHVLAAKPDVLVSADSSCLMHVAGLAEKAGRPLRTLHLAQVLRDALNARAAVPTEVRA
ncbi:MAG TPA: (Fe-S)-binding protein [Polyangia bacterium]|jgi:L-lactate dehydrogenase complex protein LldE